MPDSASNLTRGPAVGDAIEGNPAAAAGITARQVVERCRQRSGWNPSPGMPPATEHSPPTRTPLALLASRYRDLPLPAELPGQTAGIQRSPIQQLEAAIRHSPSLPEFYLRLAALYLESSRDFDAERLLERGRETTDDPRVTELWEDVLLLRTERRVQQAEKNVTIDGSPEVQQALDQVRRERDELEIGIFNARRQRDPRNPEVRYQLGLRLKQAGKLREACQQFTEALTDPGRASAAAFQMGDCWQRLGDFPAALKHYRLAAEYVAVPDGDGWRQQSLYQAAELARQIKLPLLARRYLRQLQKIDPTYRDVAQRLQDAGDSGRT